MFADVVGQEPVKRRFATALSAWRDGRAALHHAYLFSGPQGLGKRAFAEELGARIVAGGSGDDAYERARRGVHPDLTIIEREGDVIRYEQVSKLVAELSLKPFLAAERVWIVTEADKLHPAAANKLLKSLEEPPAHVVFLLVTDEEERVLPTILSRCEVVPFEPVPQAAVRGLVAGHDAVDDKLADAIADLAGGSPGRALRLLEDVAGPDRRGALLTAVLGATAGERVAERVIGVLSDYEKEVAAAIESRAAAEVAAAEASLQDDRDRAWRIEQIGARARRDTARETREVALWCLDVVISVLRDLWVASVGGDGVLLNVDHSAAITAAAAGRSTGSLAEALAAAISTRRDLWRNVDRELAVLALVTAIEEVSTR